MTDFLSALALVFVIEGLAYAIAPGLLRLTLRRLETIPDRTLRAGGLLAAVIGVAAVWLVRGGM
jgi:uncharacterized protein